MDYQKIYYQIIKRAQTRNLEGYVENHHIIPRCMGGEDIVSNVVALTAREHFICHMLLCEIYPNENKLKHALFLMAMGKQKPKDIQYYISARTYERLKVEHSAMLTGISQSIETRHKKSKSMVKVWDGKTEEEKKNMGKKIWETRRRNGTDKITQTQAKNISKALKGREITWDRGRNSAVSQYDLEGNHIADFKSIAEAKRQVGGDIQSALSGRSKTAKGYIWRYKK